MLEGRAVHVQEVGAVGLQPVVHRVGIARCDTECVFGFEEGAEEGRG